MSLKLQQLTQHLLDNNSARPEQLEAWVDRLTLLPEQDVCGEHRQLHLEHARCTLIIESFSGHPGELKAQLSSWLYDQDDIAGRDRHGLPDIELDITALDASGTAWDVEVSVEFLEPLWVTPDDNGSLSWLGQSWSLIDAPQVTVARSIAGVDPMEHRP